MAPAATSKSIFLVVEDEGLVRKNAVDMIEEAGFGCAVLDADQQARSVRNVSFKIKNALRFGEITRLNPVQLVLFASLPFITIADSVPKFDIAWSVGPKADRRPCWNNALRMSRQRATNSNRYGFNPVRLTKPLVSGKPT